MKEYSRNLFRGFGSRSLLSCIGVAAMFCLVTGCWAAPVSPPEEPRFEVSHVTLEEAASKAAKLTRLRFVLNVNRGHRARKTQVSLSMPVRETNDLLNALASAFGLRWLEGQPGHVMLVDKADYLGTVAGLRQALSDALPADLRDCVRPGAQNRLANVEGPLKRFEALQGERLRAASANGPVEIGTLDSSLARPLLRYLNAFAVYRLGIACDQFATEARTNASTLLHYGPNPSGTNQFSFRIKNRWIVVKPE